MLNLFGKIQDKLASKGLEKAEEFLKTLDLDKDGQADLDEVLAIVKQFQDGIAAGMGSVNAAQVTRTIQAGEKAIAAITELGAVAGEVLDTEQAKAAAALLSAATAATVALVKDVAETVQKDKK